MKALYPSRHLIQLGFSETHWKGVHAIRHTEFTQTPEVYPTVWIREQHPEQQRSRNRANPWIV